MSSGTPSQLAEVIVQAIDRLEQRAPTPDMVAHLLEVLHAVSLSTDEGATPLCDVVWLNPNNPDPDAPPLIRDDRWTFTALRTPVPLNVRELTKLSRASDPRASWLVVYPRRNSGKLFIWGLIDQAGSNFVSMQTFASSRGYVPPGLFQVSVTGLGRLEAYTGRNRIGSLHNHELRREQLDAMWSNPVRTIVSPLVHNLSRRLMSQDPALAELDAHFETTRSVVECLSRILRRIQGFKHGGCILITSTMRHTRRKYEITYPRLRDGIIHVMLKRQAAGLEYVKYRLMPPQEMISADAVVKHRARVVETEDAQSEQEGAEWFVSLLTRVDGAVVMSADLVVQAYGGEITTSRVPPRLWLAGDLNGTKRHARRTDYEHFGTRHRSAMRYCAAVPRSVALVVSQDGDVRVIANVSGRVTVWENVKLGFAEFVHLEDPIA